MSNRIRWAKLRFDSFRSGIKIFRNSHYRAYIPRDDIPKLLKLIMRDHYDLYLLSVIEDIKDIKGKSE